jgi:exopolysaccharide biosynthesis protein
MLSKKTIARFGLFSLSVFLAPSCASADWHSTHFPGPDLDGSAGIAYSLDTTFSNKKVHVLRIDLANPRVKLRASTPDERGLTPSEFSKKAGTIAAINGDFFDGLLQPIGLAVGNGAVWPKTADTKEWSFLACTETNDCMIDDYNRVTPWRPDWKTVIGGWQILMDPGFEWTTAYDQSCGDFCTIPHPRTAVGLSADKKTMWWVMVEGRQGSLTGLTLADTTRIFKRLGAEWALNLDGGGSSGIVLNGRRVNGRPFGEPLERRVSNCLGLIIGPE